MTSKDRNSSNLQKFFIGLALVILFFNAKGNNNSSSTSTPSTDLSVSKNEESLKTEAGLISAIQKELGSVTNRNVQKNVNVTFDGKDLYVDFALNDNLSSKLIITGAWKDAEKVIVLAQESGLVNNLTINGTFALQDKFGQPLGEVSVFTANFLEDSIPKINTAAFTSSMYAEVATSVIIHPGLK